MGFLLFASILALPAIEIIVLLQVGHALGLVQTLALLFASAAVGIVLVRWQGADVLRRIREEAAAGRVPGKALLDGLLVFIAAGLLIFPGLVSDAIALLLLLPPTRALIRVLAVLLFTRSIRRGVKNGTVRVVVGSAGPAGASYSATWGGGFEGPRRVRNVTPEEERPVLALPPPGPPPTEKP